MVRINYHKIKQIREEKGITRDGLAKRAGVSLQEIINIERGFENPSAITLYFIAKAFGCSTDSLYIDDTEKCDSKSIKTMIIRIPAEIKSVIQQSAQEQGYSINQFVLQIFLDWKSKNKPA